MTTWENGRDCCSWAGVSCHPISGHVTELDLSCSGLHGKIHPNISLDLSGNNLLKWKEDTWKRLLQNATVLRVLVFDYGTDMSSISIRTLNLSSSLVTLSLRANGLRGNLTDGILCLPNLQHLDLSVNNLNGSIPPFFSNFTHLTSLDLSENNLNGSIPPSFSNLIHLTSLALSRNNLRGQIPDVFPQSNSFHELVLSGNKIEGELPSTLSNLQHLIHLHLSYNKLEGPLPNNITGFSNLTSLWLNGNLLNGTIPSWCLSWPSLVDLDLSRNQFSGHISAISSYSLKRLFLSHNKLQGNIPESIFSLLNLTDLDLSSNNLSGSVKFHRFSKLQNLATLHLSQNDQLSLNFKSNVSYSFSNLLSLDLSSMGLTEFPKLWGKVPILESLYLSNNKLKGRVPNWLHEISLSELDLSHNLLTQSLHQFSWNQQLGYLDLSFNSITGDFSSSICNASAIEILNLSHNKLTGTIPQCLANSSSLQVLDLQLNKLHGTLPSTFAKDCWLRTLDLNGNQLLEGFLPESLSNCINLEVLDLGNNQIKDVFPHWLQILPELKVLVLRANKLYGPIAGLKTKHGFPSLVIFDVSSNNFSGPIPKAYIKTFEAMKNVALHAYSQYMEVSVNASSGPNYTDSVTITTKAITMTMDRIRNDFVSIDLSQNRFEGDIPSVIGELHSLRGLNLSHNRLIGPIPQSMGNLTNLESLDLSSNMLTGGIPTELSNLNFLEVLNLSNNHLVGEIPQGKQFGTFSNDSYEGNSGLCGLPLTIKCSKDPEQHSPPSTTFRREGGFGFGWKPVAIGYGCGMVFGVGMGCCVLLIGKPQWLVRMVGGQLNKKVKRKTRMRSNENGLPAQNSGSQWQPTIRRFFARIFVQLHCSAGFRSWKQSNKGCVSPLASNSTEDAFPSLVIFDVSSNNFSGPIPKAYIKKFEAMKTVFGHAWQYIDFVEDSNYADSVTITTKAITMTMDRIRNDFVSIDLSQNRFEGEIPSVIGELHSLRGLNLSHNRLIGPIPQSVGNLRNLESLDLSSNMLTGGIPTELINLNFLEVLNLSNNNLVGEIPQGKQFGTFSNDSYEGNSGLCGLPLTIKCSKDPEQHSPPSTTFRREGGFGFGWKPVAIGYGCGMVFGVGMGCCVLLMGKPQWLVRMVGGQLNKKVKRKTRMKSNENEPSGEEQEKFRSNFKIISSSFASLPFKLPGTAFHRGIKARDRMYEMLDSTISRRRSGQEFQQDFLGSLVMKHSKEDGEEDENKLTDKQLKDNILTLLVAGHDTTAAALTWLIKFLGENPIVLEQLREEHRQIVINRKSGTDHTWAEVNNMPYTAKVISETLRRATILPWFSRKASQDFEIDGYKIKKGWSVNLDVVSIHHDPEVFPDPEKFDPSRFDETLRPFSFLGFGSGPRMCPGMNLAKLEICVFIHHLVNRYKKHDFRGEEERKTGRN
ncbi:Receptor-like protein 33 [Glycine soja]|uniref:Receptor-like protein 33 n=1 Tax=Glycine soja TaxID=3848 RepID=A0A445GJM3_GLYSO|nr:Receptor-like protein 33 [Glycine soja]